ncbi:hypothetical protein HUB98_24225 [Paenibacillus barcinonensis]|uniref:Uncharacterized protein n=1 Tax=Paenibacillus barcinonensis TaxID=198119 RepID=A0ABX6Q9X2_PAEBA|nr:hypothetical protein [Paenibacillus barcinonensis]QKS59008.1 hypothetical protein HUB98_24225 [Paenibacillus barcinonensis]
MGKYGEAAVKTVNYLNEHKHDDPIKAWNEVTIEIFGEGSSSQKKGCPKNTFLGLSEEGLLEGIPRGIYTKSKKNKGYGLKAVKILGEIDKDKNINQRILWKEVIGDQDIKYNSQMDVVLALWKEGMIKL